jgi:RNA-binding protein
MTLTGSQKRMLRARGQKMADDAHVGKAGATDAALANLRMLLDRKELVKVRFDDLEGSQRNDFARELAASVEALCIAVVGRTALLYRANPALDPARRSLPASHPAGASS